MREVRGEAALLGTWAISVLPYIELKFSHCLTLVSNNVQHATLLQLELMLLQLELMLLQAANYFDATCNNVEQQQQQQQQKMRST